MQAGLPVCLLAQQAHVCRLCTQPATSDSSTTESIHAPMNGMRRLIDTTSS